MSKISKPEGLSHFSISFMKRLKFSSLTFEFSRRRVIFEDFLKCQEDESVLNVTPNYLHRNRFIFMKVKLQFRESSAVSTFLQVQIP